MKTILNMSKLVAELSERSLEGLSRESICKLDTETLKYFYLSLSAGLNHISLVENLRKEFSKEEFETAVKVIHVLGEWVHDEMIKRQMN